PAVITSPPAHGPTVLPTLNAEVLTAAANVGASPATTKMRALSPGAIENPATPTAKIAATVATGWSDTAASTTSVTVSATRLAKMLVNRPRSATRPPMLMPMNVPIPNSASTSGTDRSLTPDTSVSSGAK